MVGLMNGLHSWKVVKDFVAGKTCNDATLRIEAAEDANEVFGTAMEENKYEDS